jgi:hypothetical protein
MIQKVHLLIRDKLNQKVMKGYTIEKYFCHKLIKYITFEYIIQYK